MYCLPWCIKVIGTAVVLEGILTAPTCFPVAHNFEIEQKRPDPETGLVYHQRVILIGLGFGY